MKNLLKIGRSLSSVEMKNITAGFGEVIISDGSGGCGIGIGIECPPGLVCEISTEQCIVPGGGDGPGGGGICPENVGMNCNSPV